MKNYNNFILENIDLNNIKTYTISSKELLQKIEYNTADLDTRIKYFKGSDFNNTERIYTKDKIEIKPIHNYFTILELNNKIIGVANIYQSPYEHNVLWMKFLSIDEKYQNLHLTKYIVDELFKFISKNLKDFKLEPSTYSKIGFLKLKPLLKKYSEIYNVELIDNQNEPKFQ